MPAAGMLLTGGASRRMGTDKATLVLAPGGETLAQRTARLLAATTRPAIEVGPGHSNLPTAAEGSPGAGPLPAIVAGLMLLDRLGGEDAVIVVATDLPFLTEDLLGWLAAHPSGRSVVPVAAGRAQTLCARYTRSDLRHAAGLTQRGAASMREFVASIEPLLVGEDEWGPAARDRRALIDVDTREDLEMVRKTCR
jgi:molybdopterin-guanine dinucleotide biosynthesis protein A